VYGVAFSRDGKTVATGSLDGSVKLWDAATGRCTATVAGKGPIFGVAFSPRDESLAAAGTEGAWLYDTAQGKERWSLPKKGMLAVAFSPDGNTVATTGSGEQFGPFQAGAETVLMQADSGKEITNFKEPRCYGWSVAYAPDGKALAVAERGCVTFLNPEANKKRQPVAKP
jgi:WD40 repeat protein